MEQSYRYKQSLLKSIEREWVALMNVIDRLNSTQMVTPDGGGWSPKDNLAHMTMWLKALLGHHIDHKPGTEVLGIPPELEQNFDYNRVNAFMFQQDKDRSVTDVLTGLQAAYSAVLSRLETMSLEELMQPRYADDPEKRPLVLWVLGNTSEHFAEHRISIEKLLK